VKRYGGTVDKFTGDGIVAVFGAPVALEDHAIRACLAALGIQEETARLAAEVKDPDDDVALRDIWLRRLRALLARAHGDDASYRETPDRMVGLAGFYGSRRPLIVLDRFRLVVEDVGHNDTVTERQRRVTIRVPPWIW
jgi:hypothetical protein